MVFEGRRRAGVQIAVEFTDPDGHNLEVIGVSTKSEAMSAYGRQRKGEAPRRSKTRWQIPYAVRFRCSPTLHC